MLLNRGPSWRQRSRPQLVNLSRHLNGQVVWKGDLRHLRRDAAAGVVNVVFGSDLAVRVAPEEGPQLEAKLKCPARKR